MTKIILFTRRVGHPREHIFILHTLFKEPRPDIKIWENSACLLGYNGQKYFRSLSTQYAYTTADTDNDFGYVIQTSEERFHVNTPWKPQNLREDETRYGVTSKNPVTHFLDRQANKSN